MLKRKIVLTMMILLGMINSISTTEIEKAIQFAYNFQFTEAEEVLNRYRLNSPDDFQGIIGQIIYDFMRIKQNPLDENFDRMYSDLDEAEEVIENLSHLIPEQHVIFYTCFVEYYAMKSYALEERWLHTASHALEARKLAVQLEDNFIDYPDLLFILGEQDYTTSLAPDYLKPLLKGLNFSPDRTGGLENINIAVSDGGLTRYEAALFYIGACIYTEKDYSEAMAKAEAFLNELPENLSVRFFYIDLLLRMGQISEAESWMDHFQTRFDNGEINGKWVPRFIQMKGNLYNARGQYDDAVDFYQKALEFDTISGYTATEIALETGKLLDILGRRREAIDAYKMCYRGSGLTLQKDEAKALKKEAYIEERGSY